jgi:hypothetical protein
MPRGKNTTKYTPAAAAAASSSKKTKTSSSSKKDVKRKRSPSPVAKKKHTKAKSPPKKKAKKSSKKTKKVVEETETSGDDSDSSSDDDSDSSDSDSDAEEEEAASSSEDEAMEEVEPLPPMDEATAKKLDEKAAVAACKRDKKKEYKKLSAEEAEIAAAEDAKKSYKRHLKNARARRLDADVATRHARGEPFLHDGASVPAIVEATKRALYELNDERAIPITVGKSCEPAILRTIEYVMGVALPDASVRRLDVDVYETPEEREADRVVVQAQERHVLSAARAVIDRLDAHAGGHLVAEQYERYAAALEADTAAREAKAAEYQRRQKERDDLKKTVEKLEKTAPKSIECARARLALTKVHLQLAKSATAKYEAAIARAKGETTEATELTIKNMEEQLRAAPARIASDKADAKRLRAEADELTASVAKYAEKLKTGKKYQKEGERRKKLVKKLAALRLQRGTLVAKAKVAEEHVATNPEKHANLVKLLAEKRASFDTDIAPRIEKNAEKLAKSKAREAELLDAIESAREAAGINESGDEEEEEKAAATAMSDTE